MALNNPLADVDFNKINDILASKSFENIAGLTGAFLSSKGQADRADKQGAQSTALSKAQLGQNANHFATELAARLAESRKNQGLERAVASMNATRLGENENFATRNRILSAIIPNLRNSNVMPTDPRVAARVSPVQGPLPEGGLPPAVLAALSERSTANAIANRSKQLLNIDPNAPAPNFDAMGFAEGTDTFDLAGHRQGLLDADAASQSSLDDIISRALQQDYEGINAIPDQAPEEEKKKGFWGKLGGILKVAAPIASMFIPGVGPIAAAAIAGGGSAAGSLMQGDDLGQALLGGGLSAAGTYGARNLPRRPTNINGGIIDRRFPGR